MSREIKFRFFDGNRFRFPEYLELESNRFFDTWRDIENNTPIENLIVMQFTGWNDTKINSTYPKGQPIYEGDILRDKNGTISYVVWEDGGFAVKSTGSEAVDWEHGGWYSDTEVIGNIHSNPELLNQ